ncbi:MAG: acyltransferase [Culicoidibacterales bacterium]
MKRNLGIEYLRVYASLGVIVIHVSALAIRQLVSYGHEFPLLLDVLSRAAVPLFFMISGYLLLNPAKTITLPVMWRKTKQRIILPLIYWLVIYWLFSLWFYWWRFEFATPLTMSSEFFVGITTYHFWFLPVLAGYYLVTPWLNYQLQIKSERHIFGIIAASLLFGLVMQILSAWTNEFGFELLKNLGFTGYFLFGYVVKQKCWTIPKRLGLIGYVACMSLTGVIFLSTYQILSPIQTINLITDNFFPLISIGSGLLFVSFVHQPYRRRWLNRIILALSPYTFGIYFVHVAILSLLASLGEVGWFPMVSNSLVLTLAVYLISLLISYLMKKSEFFQRFV